jgi:hypothetical protein
LRQTVGTTLGLTLDHRSDTIHTIPFLWRGTRGVLITPP